MGAVWADFSTVRSLPLSTSSRLLTLVRTETPPAKPQVQRIRCLRIEPKLAPRTHPNGAQGKWRTSAHGKQNRATMRQARSSGWDRTRGPVHETRGCERMRAAKAPRGQPEVSAFAPSSLEGRGSPDPEFIQQRRGKRRQLRKARPRRT